MVMHVSYAILIRVGLTINEYFFYVPKHANTPFLQDTSDVSHVSHVSQIHLRYDLTD